MNTRAATLTLMIATFTLSATCSGQTWQTAYQTDFSSNPGWIISDPTHYSWDSLDGTFYIDQQNINYGGNYAVTDTGHNGGSFVLQFDICMLSTGYASAVSFGLYDSDLNSNNTGSYAEVHFCREDRGHVIFLESRGQDDVPRSDVSTSPQFSLGTWYSIVMEYDEDAGTLTAAVTVRDTGTSFAYLSVSGVGPFASDMGLLGNSNIRDYTYQVPGSHCTAKVDNVLLTVPSVAIQASVNIDPDVLNLTSDGKYIICYVTLPESYQVDDIDPTSILLNALIAPTWSTIEEEEQVLKLKFDRAAVQELLVPGEVELTVTGLLTGEILFEGSDTIRVIDPGKK